MNRYKSENPINQLHLTMHMKNDQGNKEPVDITPKFDFAEEKVG